MHSPELSLPRSAAFLVSQFCHLQESVSYR